LLERRVGETFAAAVLDTDDGRARGMIALPDPPVRARCTGDLTRGEAIHATLVIADPATRTVAFEKA